MRFLLSLLLMAGLGWTGLKVYYYLFDTDAPVVMISGLHDGSYYSGDIKCYVTSDKCAKILMWLDDKMLTDGSEMCKKDQEYPFVIPTLAITNGMHVFKFVAKDTTYHRNIAEKTFEFNVDNVPLQAALVSPGVEQKVFQGRTLHVQFQVNKSIKHAQVKALARSWDCYPEESNSNIYECFIPVACEEQPNEYLFSIEVADNVKNQVSIDNKFQVVVYPFKRETLHVSKDKLKEEEELGLADGLGRALEEITRNSPREKLWRGTFCPPIDIQRTTCDFGTIRTTQEKGRYIHRALDIINAPKSVIWAPQDGVIALKERYADTGNTVVIDHGCGIISLFCHLDSFAKIETGDKVIKGNPLGTIGKTGYATGYHLHWEQRVDNVAIDPIQWTKMTF